MSKVICISKVILILEDVPNSTLTSHFEMFAPDTDQMCNAVTSEQEQAKLQKIKELMTILQVYLQ